MNPSRSVKSILGKLIGFLLSGYRADDTARAIALSKTFRIERPQIVNQNHLRLAKQQQFSPLLSISNQETLVITSFVFVMHARFPGEIVK